MKIEKPRKKSPEELEQLAQERIWQGDAPGAKYFPPGQPVPRSAWERVPGGDPHKKR